MPLFPRVDMNEASLTAISKTTAPPGLDPFVELVELPVSGIDVQCHALGVQ